MTRMVDLDKIYALFDKVKGIGGAQTINDIEWAVKTLEQFDGDIDAFVQDQMQLCKDLNIDPRDSSLKYVYAKSLDPG
jgi:hypothetical protein